MAIQRPEKPRTVKNPFSLAALFFKRMRIAKRTIFAIGKRRRKIWLGFVRKLKPKKIGRFTVKVTPAAFETFTAISITEKNPQGEKIRFSAKFTIKSPDEPMDGGMPTGATKVV